MYTALGHFPLCISHMMLGQENGVYFDCGTDCKSSPMPCLPNANKVRTRGRVETAEEIKWFAPDRPDDDLSVARDAIYKLDGREVKPRTDAAALEDTV